MIGKPKTNASALEAEMNQEELMAEFKKFNSVIREEKDAK